MVLLTICQATFSNIKEVVVDTKAPANPYKGLSWTDTSKTPPVTKIWNGSKWVDKLSEVEATVKTHTEKLSTHDAKISANETAINLRVTTSDFESYKTTVNSELSSAKSRLSASETSIQTLQGQIALKVEQTDIDTAVEKIEVGGRNLWKNSTFDQGMDGYGTVTNEGTLTVVDGYSGHKGIRLSRSGYTGTTRCWAMGQAGSISSAEYSAGDTFTLSAWVYIEAELVRSSGQRESAIMIRGSIGDYPQITIPETTPVGQWVNLKESYTFKADGEFNNPYVLLGANGSMIVSCIKLEKGTKATDWTPAPEDVDASITAVDAKFSSYSTTAQMQSAITAARNSITASVSESYATKSALEIANGNITSLASRVSSAESRLTKDSLVTTIGSYYATTDNLNYANTFIIGTQTAVTGAWTGKAAFPILRDGQQITYWLPYNGSGNATLNLTLSDGKATGAIPCYYSGVSRLTTHYAAGNAIRLTYRENVTIGSTTIAKGWWADANYDSNTMDRLRYQSAIKTKNAVTAGRLIVSDGSGYFHVAAGTAFDTRKAILWAGSNIAAGATGTNNYKMYSNVNVAASKSGWTGTQYASVYLVGTLSGVFFTPGDALFTTAVPTTEDGLTYILLGQTYSTTNMVLFAEHPMYRYINGAFQKVEQGALTIANQTAEKFQWIVKSGTSATDFTLTDRTATLVAETISLNGNVKVNGSMLVDGAVTAAKLSTDAVKSRNYAYSSGNFSTAGTFLDLSTGLIRSKNFAIDSAGNAYFRGSLSGATGSFSGDVTATNAVIKDKIKMYAPNAWGDETQYDIITATNTTGQAPDLKIGNGTMYIRINGPTYITGTYAELHVSGVAYATEIGCSGRISGNAITSVNSVFTNSKTSAVDGVRGVCVGVDASVSLTGDATYVPRINFMYNGATATQAQIRSSAANKLDVNASAGINLNAASGVVRLSSVSCAIDTTGAITLDNGKYILGMFNSETNLRVATDYDNKVNLGMGSARWMKVYAASGTIGTSDERDKDILGNIDERYRRFYMTLEPILYRWKDRGVDAKIHVGLGAQRTERSALACGIASAEIGMIEHDFWSEPSRDGRTDRYGMNYQEVAVLTVPIVQEHERRLNVQSDRIAFMQSQLAQALARIDRQDARIADQAAEIARLQLQVRAAAG